VVGGMRREAGVKTAAVGLITTGLPCRSHPRCDFALGVEGLDRFVKREPLRRVHECVFGVLALESEPVDPRL
jgi:PNKP (polynucleotide 5'-kinase/3'-phosphatase) family adenylyltransferase-like protein